MTRAEIIDALRSYDDCGWRWGEIFDAAAKLLEADGRARLFTIGMKDNACAGHGDNYSRVIMTGMRPYDSPPYWPLFRSRQAAQDFLDKSPHKPLQPIIVELEVM